VSLGGGPQVTQETAPTPSGGRRRSLLRLVLEEGGPGVCYFALNNACNARCDFCNFSRDKLPRSAWKFVDRGGAFDAIDILFREGIRYLVLYGGEPLLHPDLTDIARRASERGLTPLLITNGALLRPERVRELAEAGVRQFLISIDAASVEAHEQNRGLPGVCAKIREATRVLHELGLAPIASVTMSRLVDYEALPAFLDSLGFGAVSFSYPINQLGSSFLGYSDSHLVKYEPDELVESFEQVKRLKRRFHVTNPTASLEEMQRFTRGEEQRFECLGGFRYFHLDWNLDVWRCHFWDRPMCSIYEFDSSRRIRDGCTRCMIDCYRDSSLLQQVAVSAHDAYQALKGGRVRQAAGALTRSQNWSSIGALLEELPYVIRFVSRRPPA